MTSWGSGAIRRILFGVAVAAATLPLAPVSQAQAGTSFCEGPIELHPHGTPDPDGYQPSHSGGECETSFQGFPVGVIGVFDSATIDGPAEVHVEAFAVLATGTRYKLAECEAEGEGAVRCELERNDLGQALTLPEPVPAEIVSIECAGHSHAPVKIDPEAETQPWGRFGCYTTDEAEAQLRDDMGVPAEGGGGGDEPADDGAPVDPTGIAAGSTVAAVYDSYVPPSITVSQGSGLTFANFDQSRHDVVAKVYDDGDQLRPDHVRADGSAEWCAEAQPGACPLFWSELIEGPAATTPVLGLDDLVPGTTYEFFCTIHNYMRGTLQVTE